MRGLFTTLALVSLSHHVVALPLAQVGTSADTSQVQDGGTSADTSQVQGGGQGTNTGDNSTVSDPAFPAAPSVQPVQQVDSSTDASGDTSTVSEPTAPAPVTQNADSTTDTSATADNSSTAADGTSPPVASPSVESTGQLLGMSSCNGTYYNPRWDSCDEATGKITSKTPKTSTPKISTPRPSTAESATVQSSPKEKREAVSQYNNDWNTPFSSPAPSETPTVITEDLKFGNGSMTKTKRRADSANLLNTRLGPLKGEDEVLDGSHPAGKKGKRAQPDFNYIQAHDRDSHPPEENEKRAVDVVEPAHQEKHVETGPSINGGPRNIIINKRQNSTGTQDCEDNSGASGYLAALGCQSGSLNFEDPALDPGTPPKKKAFRA